MKGAPGTSVDGKVARVPSQRSGTGGCEGIPSTCSELGLHELRSFDMLILSTLNHCSICVLYVLS